ncbi:MAG TPA: porphobilinogen synthase [Gemmatimonadaceae bacterium]|nr:porphobilinogen synthase [Gemmatimonadaceae bacterium]
MNEWNETVRTDATSPGRVRPRRLRKNAALRGLVAETSVLARQLVMPHFVLPVAKAVEPIPSMPQIFRTGVEDLLRAVGSDLELGIRSVLLFGTPPAGAKDATGTSACDPAGAVPGAVRALRDAFGDDLVIMTDVCLCAYTDHGHCGVLSDGVIDNDKSLVPLAAMALAHAEAGADLVGPSDMMDGRVAALRDALDAEGHADTGILSYAVKYASAYYGPFREAADSSPQHGDRRSYQMDARNGAEAEREAKLDEAEGADIVMVKPALAYLDVIRRVRSVTTLPLAAYNVSGEYSQVKAAAERGWLDEAAIVRENLHAIVRAGADIIITYHARAALAGGWL